MSKKHEKLCTDLISELGGKDNIVSALHCETRLRFYLKDKSLINKDNVDKINGVLGCQFVGDQFQVIIGQHVHDVYAELCDVMGVSQEKQLNENVDKNNKVFKPKGIYRNQ